MTISAAAVVVVASGGIPVTNLGAAGAVPLTVVASGGTPVTIVASGGLPVTLLNADGSFYGFDAASLALFAAMTTPPTTARQSLINACIVALKTAGIWSQLDVLYVLAAADSQAASLNWVSPSTFALVATASPTFTADRGYAGNGSTSHLDTGWTPSINAVNYTQNSASAWAWDLTATEEDNNSILGNSTAPRTKIGPRGASSTSMIRINDNTDQSTAVATAVGFWGAQRRASTDKRAWMNGAQLGTTASTASTGIPSQSQWICGSNSTLFSAHQVAAAAWGASLSGLEAPLYSAMLAYMQGVGAA